MNLLPEHGNDNTLTGVSEVSLKEFLGGNWKPLIDLIVSGDIKGIAGVVGCSNLTAGGHDVLTVEMTKELIAKDIPVSYTHLQDQADRGDRGLRRMEMLCQRAWDTCIHSRIPGCAEGEFLPHRGKCGGALFCHGQGLGGSIADDVCV